MHPWTFWGFMGLAFAVGQMFTMALMIAAGIG
jgi:hypothetical protein